MRTRPLHLLLATALASAAMFVCSCKREDRGFRVVPPAAESISIVKLTDVEAGGRTESHHVTNPYEQNAYAMGEGQNLFESFNCSGCHAHGGGGMGPPLMDNRWIYGSQPEQIYATIVQGRPNGMPSFRNKIPNHQVWELVSFVRSLSGLANPNAAPSREDHMKGPPPPNSTKPEKPADSSIPPSAEHP